MWPRIAPWDEEFYDEDDDEDYDRWSKEEDDYILDQLDKSWEEKHPKGDWWVDTHIVPNADSVQSVEQFLVTRS